MTTKIYTTFITFAVAFGAARYIEMAHFSLNLALGWHKDSSYNGP